MQSSRFFGVSLFVSSVFLFWASRNSLRLGRVLFAFEESLIFSSFVSDLSPFESTALLFWMTIIPLTVSPSESTVSVTLTFLSRLFSLLELGSFIPLLTSIMVFFLAAGFEAEKLRSDEIKKKNLKNVSQIKSTKYQRQGQIF